VRPLLLHGHRVRRAHHTTVLFIDARTSDVSDSFCVKREPAAALSIHSSHCDSSLWCCLEAGKPAERQRSRSRSWRLG